MKLPQLSLRDLFWLVLVCLSGCVIENYNVDPPLPRAVPVRLEDVPPATLEGFHSRYPDIGNPVVERCVDEKRGYRFTLPDGGWVSYGKDGKLIGGVR